MQNKYKEETEIENLIQKYDGEMGEKQVDLNFADVTVDFISTFTIKQRQKYSHTYVQFSRIYVPTTVRTDFFTEIF